MNKKKITILIVVLMGLFLQACGSSSASAVNESVTDYSPVIGYDFKSTSESAVEVSSQQTGTVVKFTTDGTTPTFSTSTTNMSFTVTEETTVKAITYDNSGNALSDVITVTVPVGKMPLTIMYYGDADNNLESYLLGDVAEMKSGYSKAGYNLITLFDRVGNSIGSADSTDLDVFGENFTGTRLYKVGENTTTRLSDSSYLGLSSSGDSDELNMGDANTLKEFIQYCKANYPADKYVLIISNHGGGTRSVKSTSSSVSKDICEDVTNSGDIMYTGEISDVLTSNESVDAMVLDACLMGSVEFAYQFRNDSSNTGFVSDYMVASPANVRGEGLPYTTMLERIRGISGNNGTTNTLGGGSEAYIVPSSAMDMAEFSKMIVEEQYDSASTDSSQTFSAYDLSEVATLKIAIDTFAKSIVNNSEQTDFESIRGTNWNTNTAMNYIQSSSSSYWGYYPFFDIYDLMRAVKSSSSFSTTIKTNATAVQTALANVILSSFGGTDYYNANDSITFVNNKNGMHIVFPKLYTSGATYSLSYLYWYTPVDIASYLGSINYLYGKLEFCNGGTSSNSQVENWFEMMDKWYDNTGTSLGVKGYNGYHY